MKTKKRIELSMNIDDLRANWNSIDIPAGMCRPVQELERRIVSSNVTTLRSRLLHIYVLLGVMCLMGVLFMIPFVKDLPRLVVCADVFYVVVSGINFYMSSLVRRIDYSRMTVKEALEAVYKVERYKIRARMCTIVMAVPLICYMIFSFAHLYGEVVLFGCACGAVLGGVIGIIIHRRMMSVLREMRRQLTLLDEEQA